MFAKCGAELNHRFHNATGFAPDANAMFSPVPQPDAASRSALAEWTSAVEGLFGLYDWARCSAHPHAKPSPPAFTPRAPSPDAARLALRMSSPVSVHPENVGVVCGAAGPG